MLGAPFNTAMGSELSVVPPFGAIQITRGLPLLVIISAA